MNEANAFVGVHDKGSVHKVECCVKGLSEIKRRLSEMDYEFNGRFCKEKANVFLNRGGMS